MNAPPPDRNPAPVSHGGRLLLTATPPHHETEAAARGHEPLIWPRIWHSQVARRVQGRRLPRAHFPAHPAARWHQIRCPSPHHSENTSGPAHDGQARRGSPTSRPAAAYASTASGHGHTMATVDTAPDPFSRSAQHGRSRPRGCAASGCDDRRHAGLLPRAGGRLRTSPSSQRSVVQKQKEISKCRRR